MGSASRASLIVAASVGAVEVLKDQAGLCRWIYAVRSLHQHAKDQMGFLAQARTVAAAASCSSSIDKRTGSEKAKQAEESLRKVMYLSCWGPN